VAVVGFDDIELASFTFPPLTTVCQPKEQIGQRVIQLLLERIADPSLPPRREVLDTSLVIRESSSKFFTKDNA